MKQGTAHTYITAGIIAVGVFACATAALLSNPILATGIALWAAILAIASMLLPRARAMEKPACEMTRAMKAVTCFIAAVEIAICVLPMGLNPIWNGENPQHRNQYELIADSFIDGQLSFEYDDVDPLLEEMDNPYDPHERREAGVNYHKDHAYYQGTYYMYFGAAPALLLFVPFKLLTGTSLTTYHATQIFVALIVIGFFLLFRMFASAFFRKMPFGTYLALSVGMSALSVWYAVCAPALYCTAITGGICFVLFALYCFIRAFMVETSWKRTVVLSFVGALLGATAFACRPPIALANFAVIPLLISFLRRRESTGKQKACLFAAGLAPYLVIGAALMAYNYARFGNPVEFGQAYQLTNADQHLYGFTLSRVDIPGGLAALFTALFEWKGLTSEFPFVQMAGTFWNFPFLFVIAALIIGKVRTQLKAHRGLGVLTISLLVVVFITVAADLFWSPYYLERYNTDIYYLLGICCFIACAACIEASSDTTRRYLGSVFAILAFATFLTCVLFFFVPNDSSYSVIFPEVTEAIGSVVTLGLGG